jgi:hypothetical protein
MIWGGVSRPAPMTVRWASYAQSLTSRPMEGMLTGPVTMLQWSFVRDDLPREVVCRAPDRRTVEQFPNWWRASHCLSRISCLIHAADATEGRFPEPVGYVGVNQTGPELSVPFGGSIHNAMWQKLVLCGLHHSTISDFCSAAMAGRPRRRAWIVLARPTIIAGPFVFLSGSSPLARVVPVAWRAASGLSPTDASARS